jgi:AmiR/NasT family two-component response regulator
VRDSAALAASQEQFETNAQLQKEVDDLKQAMQVEHKVEQSKAAAAVVAGRTAPLAFGCDGAGRDACRSC